MCKKVLDDKRELFCFYIFSIYYFDYLKKVYIFVGLISELIVKIQQNNDREKKRHI